MWRGSFEFDGVDLINQTSSCQRKLASQAASRYAVEMAKGGWVYIMTNRRYGVLYVGMTANLPARILQHREGRGSHYARRYNLKMLVYYEWIDSIEDAIVREKRVKAWQRMWRIELIETMNPGWHDLWDQLNA